MIREIEESRSFRPWASRNPPGKILVIRLHAIGDVVITLPACVALRRMFPEARIDFLTSDACIGIPQAIRLFDRIYSVDGSRGRWRHYYQAIIKAAGFHAEHYDVVLDLQRHRTSRLMRRITHPLAWGEFDRFSPRHALERVVDTFHRTGFADLKPVFKLDIKSEIRERSFGILRENGWDGKAKLVMLNPAGLWITRNWPLQRYEELADLWSETEHVLFLFLGNRIGPKASELARRLEGRAVDLTNKTTLSEALGVIQHVSVVISEDSGLLHMAWVSGITTVALLGSTRSDWTRPLGRHSRCLGSEDLPCGGCMQPVCRFDDVHCLSRHSAETVLRLAQEAERGS